MDRSHLEAALKNPSGLSNMKPDLIVLDSYTQTEDWMRRDQIELRNACKPIADCPVFVSPWISDEQKNAAALVLNALSSGD
jgi:hypothetical protein